MSLEKKKIELDIMKAQTAKLELQFKIEKIKEDIQRMNEHIQLQDDRVEELKEELNNL